MTEEKTETTPPIDFAWFITGPNGARFVLYPEIGVHDTDDINRAKNWIRRNRDVVSMQIQWKEVGDTKAPPMKLTDDIIIKELRKELGKSESYIAELEEKLKSENTDEAREIRKEVKAEEIYKALRKERDAVKKENVNLRKTISELIVKLNKNQ
jgi:predicted  nucleic acid-binding Zn-ribbon protein